MPAAFEEQKGWFTESRLKNKQKTPKHTDLKLYPCF